MSAGIMSCVYLKNGLFRRKCYNIVLSVVLHIFSTEMLFLFLFGGELPLLFYIVYGDYFYTNPQYQLRRLGTEL
jgi:hypothetical protein